MQIDLSKYPEVCPDCKQPARIEFLADEINGVNFFHFCVNPKCWNYDHTWLKQQREIAEAAAKKSKAFERNSKRRWKAEIKAYKADQAKRRELYKESMR